MIAELLRNFLTFRRQSLPDGADAPVQARLHRLQTFLFVFSVILVVFVIFLARLGCPPDDKNK